MSNTIELAKSFVPKLDECYRLASLTSVLDGAPELAKQGANANELIIPMMSMDGLADYSRNGGYVQGGVTMTNETVKCNFDRGRRFDVDVMDDLETAGLAFRSPIYDLCRQTVTVYHACYNPFRVTRCVIHGAYFERKTVQTVDKSGGKSCDEFLLVIPNKNARRVAPALFNGIPGVYVLECGDRIVEGVGEEITTREQWGSFVPANRPGVVTADWVRDMGCRNVLYHVEAGGKQ